MYLTITLDFALKEECVLYLIITLDAELQEER